VEVVERVDVPGGPDVEIPVRSVRATDERGVDPGVLRGPDVGLVVADVERRVGVEVRQRLFEVVGVGLPEPEALDRRLSAVGRVEQPRYLEVEPRSLRSRGPSYW